MTKIIKNDFITRKHPLENQKAQDTQDAIFRKMSADRRVELGSQLWQLAKELIGDKIRYGDNRSKASFSENR